MEPKDPQTNTPKPELAVSSYAALGKESPSDPIPSDLEGDSNNTEEETGGDWVLVEEAAALIGRNLRHTYRSAYSIVADHPDWIIKDSSKVTPNLQVTYLSPLLIEKLQELNPPAPEGWILGEEVATAHDLTLSELRKILKRNPAAKELTGRFPGPGDKLHLYLDPSLDSLFEQEAERQKSFTISELAELVGKDRLSVRNFGDKFRSTHPEWFVEGTGGSWERYTEPLAELVIEWAEQYVEALPGWKTSGMIVVETGRDRTDLPHFKAWVAPYRESHPEWFRKFSQKGILREYYAEDLWSEYLRIYGGQAEERLSKRLERAERKELVTGLDKFIQDVQEGTSPEAQQFQQLVKLFGGTSTIDIVYHLHPEYRNLAPQYVRSQLGEYLGEFTSLPSSFSFDLVSSEAVEALSNPELKTALTEVVKKSCLAYFNQQRQEGSTHEDLDILLGYIAIQKGRSRDIAHPLLEEVLDEVAEYYRAAHEDYSKPGRIRTQLKEGRALPDVNQRINIKELADKKKILIADEMGLGKSASAILAKEALGVKQALVVVPSNVVKVWEDFLSDKVDEHGQPAGLFKEGQAPKVLVVQDPETLSVIDTDAYDFVVISQERLKDEYMNGLLELDYGMLIVDEVQKLKNIKAGKRANNLLQLAEKINAEDEDKYLALLSGTPVPNKISDLAMIMQLLYPERFADVSPKELTTRIVKGDIVDIRSSLVPRMQRKELTESVEMPHLHQETLYFDISQIEQDIYEALLEEDELSALDKMRALRQAILNAQFLDATPDFEGSKPVRTGEKLREVFANKDKVVMFVNGYVDGVIGGRDTIINALNLPADVEVRTIWGDVSQTERQAIQDELKEQGRRMLLLVSGQTADVGVDFSAAQAVFHYNEPWSEYEKMQHTARVYRPGLEGDLTSTTLIARGTIEEGIHQYIQVKYQAIEKVMRGVPISELEQEMLKKAEAKIEAGYDVNASLAEHYFSLGNRLINIFGQVKEMGEPQFRRFLDERSHAEQYAEGYRELGARSYQANATRLSGTVIDALVRSKGQRPEDVRIVDVASGPEMLRRHIPEDYTESVVSVDINPEHFDNQGGSRVQGSMLNLPFADNSLDYANLSLALHYTSYLPSQSNFERAEALQQLNRVLKPGGMAVVNLIYSMELRDEEAFEEALEVFGFSVVEEYSGEVRSGANFATKLYTLEKIIDSPIDIEELMHDLGPRGRQSLKLRKSSSSIRDSRRIAANFTIEGRRELQAALSESDQRALVEEQSIVAELEGLKSLYSTIHDIPAEEILKHSGVARFFTGVRYVLYKRLTTASGAVVVR